LAIFIIDTVSMQRYNIDVAREAPLKPSV